MPDAPVTSAIHRFTAVNSTLDIIHEFATRGAPHGTVVVAEEQLEGRGSRGRTWHSPVGGLWYSILLREGSAEDSLSLKVGLAVARAVEVVVPGARLALKWPNDLMLGERKVGGVLCEARWQGAALGWIAVGIGVNVRNPVPPLLERTATTLASIAPTLEPASLVIPITAALRGLGSGGQGLSPDEREEFDRRDWLQGRMVTEPEAGRVLGIDADGRLRVRRAGGELVLVRSGTVVLHP